MCNFVTLWNSRCSSWSTVSATTGTRSSEFKAHTFLKTSVQLQCYGSRSLLVVMSSERYQNKADSLYFHVLKTFFVFKTNFVTKSGQNHLILDQISDQLHSVFPLWDGDHGRNPQNETSEFEISASTPLPFRVLSTEATQFNFELDRRPPHCARAIQPIPLSETLCWGAYRGYNYYYNIWNVPIMLTTV